MSRLRRLGALLARGQRRNVAVGVTVALLASLLAIITMATPASAAVAPTAKPGQGPVARALPGSVRRSKSYAADERPPVVPEGTDASPEVRKVSRGSFNAMMSGARTLADKGAFTGVKLRSGFALGDTSLVAYFNGDKVDRRWTHAVFRLYETGDPKVQESKAVTREELTGLRFCGSQGEYCRTFGMLDGWKLSPKKSYVMTIAARLPGGKELVSDRSGATKPRKSIVPPSIPDDQAAGCGCANALSPTESAQATRGIGVNTGTGAFVRVESDLQMASFGVQFASARTYSSRNSKEGPLGFGWAWSYDMSVTGRDDGAVVVRAEDGAEALYKSDGDGGFNRPAGVRSNLERSGKGYALVTPTQVRYTFDAAGRLVSVLNPREVGVRLSYSDDRIVLTDASGRETTASLDEDGLIRMIKLPDHRKVRYFYEDGLLVKVKDARGNPWRYTYDSKARLVGVTDPNDQPTVRNTYGEDGRMARQVDAEGAPMTFAWDAAKQEARTTDADDVSVYDGYRGNVLVYSQRATGDSDNHRYNKRLDRNLVVNGNGYQHRTQFDLRGNPTQMMAPQGMKVKEKTEYDDRNNPTKFTDADGNVWRNDYNKYNELVSSTDAKGNKVTHAYDDRGLPTRTTDQRGKVTRYEYYGRGPAYGMLKAVVTPEGRRSEVEYDRTGRVVGQVDPRYFEAREASEKRRRHGLLDWLWRHHDHRDDWTTRVRYDEQDRVIETIQPGKQGTSKSRYDDVGRMVESRSPEGVETHYTYLRSGLPESVRTGERKTSTEYTKAGRTKAERVHMRDAPDLVTSYTYDGKGLVKTVISPRGNMPGADKADFRTTYFYDGDDNPIRVRMPYPGKPGYVDRDIKVDQLDRTTATIDELNNSAAFKRDKTGQLTQASDTMGRKISMAYDKNGQQTERRDASGSTTRTVYDKAGNKIRETSPVGGTTSYEYDDDGLLVAVTEPRGNVEGADPAKYTTRYEYDAAGNMIRETDPLGHASERTYDLTNRPVRTTDARGNSTEVRYRDDDQVAAVRNADAKHWGDSTRMHYDRDGLLTRVEDPHGRDSRTFYDDAGRPSLTIDPLGRRTEVGYDAENNVTSSITTGRHEHLDEDERAAKTMTSVYDLRGRLTEQKLGTEGPTYSYGYDAKDRTTSFVDPNGTRKVTYDDEDQIQRVTRTEDGGFAQTFRYDYDQRGNITSKHYPDGTEISQTYDKDSRPTSLTASGGSAGPDPSTWKFGYDVAGRRTSTTMPASTGLVEKRAYDRAGRLTSIGTKRASGTDPPPGVDDPVSAFELDLDEVGNPTRTQTTRGDKTESVAYAYDDMNRVESACYDAAECDRHEKASGRIDYSYDLVGNRTSQRRTGSAGHDFTKYSYDRANQLVATVKAEKGRFPSKTTYDYDVRGNQTREGKKHFDYNLDNTLASATVAGKTTKYTYDASRMRQTAKSGSGSDAETRRWTWDTNGSLEQIALDTVTTSSGTQRQGFAFGPDDEPLALLESEGGAHAYTHDWLGGIANMLTPGGEVEDGYDYDPFGQSRSGPTLADGGGGTSEPSVDNPMKFTGAYQDDSTGEGNYHLRARTYNPSSGRFTSVDPIAGDGPGASPYVYARNNPTTYTDPTGEQVAIDGGGGSAAGATSDSANPDTTKTPEVPPGPSPEDLAWANKIQSTTILDVVIQGGGAILMEVLGVTDVINCLKGDLGACVSAVVGALPWGKIFKAPKIAEGIYKAGKAVVSFIEKSRVAKKILQGAAKAKKAIAEAKAAAAAAARSAAKKAAAAKAAAKAKAKKAAAAAAAKARQQASKKKAATTGKGDGAPKDPEPAGGSRSSGGDGGSCPLRNSFTADTRVLMGDGTTKPISKVKRGDRVAATDPVTGKKGSRKVTALIHHAGPHGVVTVTLKDGSHVKGTDEHPFWVVNEGKRGGWVDAGDLRTGDKLRTSAGTVVQVSAVKVRRAHIAAHNLTVDGLHTYYVLAGDTPVLVHNCVQQNKAVGDAASDAIAARYPGSGREVTLQAMSGTRRLDVLTPDGLAIESKVGRTGLGSRERQEIARDVELLNDRNSPVQKLMWEFSTSPTTGRGGPTPKLIAELLRNQIPFTVVR
ncbi:MAG: polymorphic toxin-type HINT domain-containing protein [Nocardioides sp.]|uniref:polymorphic toxin-type HINT domain-containing protein n=1 Tax=Nocardioides sp. TaxID=35761 RepID=UPI003D6A93F9